MKSPVRQTSKESVDASCVVYQCADCEVWSCCNYGPDRAAKHEAWAERACLSMRCRCELTGDVRDLTLEMRVRRASGGDAVGYIVSIDRSGEGRVVVADFDTPFEDVDRGRYEPAANYRPEYA